VSRDNILITPNKFLCPNCGRENNIAAEKFKCQTEDCGYSFQIFESEIDADKYLSTVPTIAPRHKEQIEKYWIVSFKYKEVEPYTIKRFSDVVDENILRMILGGFGHILKASLTIIEPNFDPIQIGRKFRRIDPINPDEHLNVYCERVRKDEKGRRECKRSVYEILRKRYDEKEEFFDYCWAGMKKLFVPLMIDNIPIGFLVCGEMQGDGSEEKNEIEKGIKRVPENLKISEEELRNLIEKNPNKPRVLSKEDIDKKKEINVLKKRLEDLGENNYRSKMQAREQEFLEEVDVLFNITYETPEEKALWNRVSQVLKRAGDFGGFEYCIFLANIENNQKNFTMLASNKDLDLQPILIDKEFTDIIEKKKNLFLTEEDIYKISKTSLYRAIKSNIQICCICPFDLQDKQRGLLLFINRTGEIRERKGDIISGYTRDFVAGFARELINHIRRERYLRKILSNEVEREKFVEITFHALHQSMDSLTSKMDHIERAWGKESRDVNEVVDTALGFREDITELENMANTLYQFIDRGSGIENYRFDKPFSIVSLLIRLINTSTFFAKKRGISLLFEPPQYKLPLVYGDKDKMEVVFSNIIHNAIKYSHSNTTVNISIECIEESIKVDINNFGFGIPIEEKESIFEYGGRSKLKDPRRPIPGSGLGLSISKKIVEAHKGRLEVMSKKDGRGHSINDLKSPREWEGFNTSFIITIPIKPYEEDSG
jgi:signal transduction histidine kinase/ligand-binding sensor protein